VKEVENFLNLFYGSTTAGRAGEKEVEAPQSEREREEEERGRIIA